MHIPATSLAALTPVNWPTPAAGPSETGDAGFRELLSQTWKDTQSVTSGSQSLIETNLVSSDISMVETFTAMKEADIALRLMLQIRNKLVDAYQELQQIRF